MDTLTLALILGYTKKQVEEAKKEGFKVQVEQDRSILDRVGEEKVFYFLPKSVAESQDSYDEFVYTNNNWEKIGTTSVDLSSYATKEWTLEQIEESMTKDIASASINQNGTISFYDADGNLLFTTTGASVIGPQGAPGQNGADWVPTEQELDGIADRVIAKLPTTQGVLYGD